MRRFLQAWGRQEPSCPAEAASPPPLFSFQHQSPCATILPEPICTTNTPQLFVNIDHQLSAKLSAVASETGLFGGTVGQQQQLEQPSPPQVSQLNSPPQHPLETAASQPQLSNATSDTQSNGHLFAVAAASQQPLQQNASSIPAIQQAAPAQKGLDAFFAALANAANSPTAAAQPSPPQQSQPQQHILAAVEQKSPSSLIGQQQQQQLAESIQAAATNIANAVNAVTAVNHLMSAAIAVQQQQQTQQAAAANNTALLGTPNLLPTLKPTTTTTLLQPGIGTQSNNNHNQLGLQLAAQQPLSPAGTIVQQNMAAVALLNRLTAPNNILRPGTSQSKPIPLVEDKVDLLQFKRKEPREWNSDDVVAWILDIARRHQIPCENINLAKFASCTGPLLMLMNEQSFKEHDQNYGTLLFSEFCKLVTDENFIDEWMRSAHLNMPPGPSHQHHQQSSAVNNNQQQQIMPTITNNSMGNLLATNLALHNLATAQSLSADPGGQFQPLAHQQQHQPPQASNLLLAAAAGIAAVQQQQQKVIPSLGHLLQPPSAIAPPPSAAALLNLHSQQSNQPHLHAPQPIAASLSKMLQASQQHQLATANSQQITNRAGTSSSNGGHIGGSGAVIRRRDKEQPIRRNKDGRPRKRSQHTKGNKLWEFIRDALKDPRMCPSIVRWEDPAEGVFRIVESERLAYLWGQKKNNQKMTYEKLSRAMRTYYEKEILVPVPKSGLYPKKLVYKFGPSALGWKMTASIAVQARLAAAGGPQHHHHHHHI